MTRNAYRIIDFTVISPRTGEPELFPIATLLTVGEAAHFIGEMLGYHPEAPSLQLADGTVLDRTSGMDELDRPDLGPLEYVDVGCSV